MTGHWLPVCCGKERAACVWSDPGYLIIGTERTSQNTGICLKIVDSRGSFRNDRHMNLQIPKKNPGTWTSWTVLTASVSTGRKWLWVSVWTSCTVLLWLSACCLVSPRQSYLQCPHLELWVALCSNAFSLQSIDIMLVDQMKKKTHLLGKSWPKPGIQAISTIHHLIQG